MTLRACNVCGRLSDRSRCPDHRPKPWDDRGQRRSRTRSGWAQQRRARWVLHRHRWICHGCGRAGAQIVDHVVPLAEGGADDYLNLRPICADCHRQKVAEEAARGRARRAAQKGRTR